MVQVLCRLLPGLALLAPPALSQTEVLVATGDPLPGIGTVHEVLDLELHGERWVATVRGDAQGPAESALVVDGQVLARSGDPQLGSPQAFLGARSAGLDDLGHVSYLNDDLLTSGSSAQGVYRDLELVRQTGDQIGTPPFSATTVYLGFDQLEVEGAGSLLLVAKVDDPGDALPPERALLRLAPQVDGSWSTQLLARTGDQPAGSPSPIVTLPAAPNSMASNAGGELLAFVAYQSHGQAITKDLLPIAKVGDPAPVFGRSWYWLANTPMTLNDQGDVAFGGLLDGDFATREILIWNGIKLAQEGDVLPAIAPYALDDLGLSTVPTAQLRLTDAGQVLWYGSWTDPDPDLDEGLFLDHELLVREGATRVEGAEVVDLDRSVFDVTANGDWIGFRAQLSDGRTGAFRLRPKGGLDLVPGCAPNPSELAVWSIPQQGSSLIVSLHGAQADGVLGFGVFATDLALDASACGITLPGIGEVLIDLSAAPLLIPTLAPAAGSWASIFIQSLPVDPQLAGSTFHVQGLWLDAIGVAPGEPVRLTNAVSLSFGI